jgi:hypothetical protein
MIIAIALSSVLFLVLMTTYASVVSVTNVQSSQTELQNQFLSVYRVMEKDVRMSGFNLPGNGLSSFVDTKGKSSMIILRNDDNRSGKLSIAANIGDTRLYVDNSQGAAPGQWVYMNNGVSVSSYQIKRIGAHSGVAPDTVELSDSTLSQSWPQLTSIYFANGIKYCIDSVAGKWCLERHSNAGRIMVGPSIDSVSFIAKDSLGVALGNNFCKAQLVSITLASHFKRAAKDPCTANTFDVKLRNSL